MTRLDEPSLRFAKEHICNYYDSDFFPKPFEFDALWASWDSVVAFLTARDVEELPAPRPRLAAAPKPGGGFRVVHQLDPLSSLIYTALAYKVAPRLEQARPPIDERVACAYRVRLTDDRGSFFGDETGYQNSLDRCRELARANAYVLVTDRSDFYNQIYLHRLQNNIAHAHNELGGPANPIEDYLVALNAGVSKGIPVGPAASIIMAEAVLSDVDLLIQGTGLSHSRYVDDIRVFAESRPVLESLLQRLTVYLYDNHRLTLSSSKTEISGSDAFVRRYLESPEHIGLQAAHTRLREVTAREDAYEAYVDDNEPAAATAADPSVINTLMQRLCERDVLDLGLARHILRKSRRYRLRTIVPGLFQHFSFFAPVINDVVLYLHKVSSTSFLERHVDSIAALYDEAPAMRLPFVRLWFDDYTATYATYLTHDRVREHVFTGPSLAAQATAAITLRDLSWFRRHRGDVDSLGPWDRRQVIRSSIILARDERVRWLRRLQRNYDTLVDRTVISWLLAQ